MFRVIPNPKQVLRSIRAWGSLPLLVVTGCPDNARRLESCSCVITDDGGLLVCSLGFLAGHSFTAKGEECMVGPHRKQLLEQGALDKLLEAALTPDDVETSVFKVIQHSAAVGVMYLSTMAGTVSPKARL